MPFFFACLVVFGVVAFADIDTRTAQKKSKRPVEVGVRTTAVAQPVDVEVARGNSITIRLRGIAEGGGPIEFRLGQKPRHGRILGSTRVADDLLDVRYQHSGSRSSDFDQFVFAVRQQGIGPFSPGDVKIRVIDLPAKLVASEEFIRFPAVEIGQAETRRIVISNQGGLPANGSLRVTHPWKLEDNPHDYQIRPGSSVEIPVRFEPESAGEIQGNLVLEGDVPLSVSLAGSGIAPFATSPGEVRLEPNASGSRLGTFVIENTTAHSVPIELKTDLLAPGQPTSLELKFGEAREIRIEAPSGAPFISEVVISSGKYATRIQVSGQASPAALEIVPKSTIDLGEVAASSSLPVQVHVRNRGGTGATVTAAVTRNLQAQETTRSLPGGESWLIPIYVQTPATGTFRETLTLTASGSQTEVVISGSVAAARKPTPKSTPKPQSRIAENPATKPTGPTTPTQPSAPDEDKELARFFSNPLFGHSNGPILQATIVGRNKTSARLRWSPPAQKAEWTYAIERRDLHLDEKRELYATWTPLSAMNIEPAGDALEATIQDLQPGSPYSLRVKASAPGQSVQPASSVLTFKTLPPWRLRIDWRYPLVAILLVTGFFVVRQRWRERAAGF